MKQMERARPQPVISMNWSSINVRGGEPLPRRRDVGSEDTASASRKNSVIVTRFNGQCAESFEGLLLKASRLEGRSERGFGRCFSSC